MLKLPVTLSFFFCLSNCATSFYDETYIDELKRYLNLSKYTKGIYCDYYCDFRNDLDNSSVIRDQNVLCYCELGPDCESFRAEKFAYKERRDVLHFHNMWRNRISNGEIGVTSYGPAVKMFALNYDMELEAAAYCLSASCLAFPAACRKINKYEYYDQNIYILRYPADQSRFTTQQVLDEAIFQWVITHRFITDDHIIKKYERGRWDPFTKIAASKTTHVGCAVARFRQRGFLIEMIVCNYHPAGNTAGEPVYETVGDDRVQCPFPHLKNQWYEYLCGEVPYTNRAYRLNGRHLIIVFLYACYLATI